MFGLEQFIEDETTSQYNLMPIESICDDGRGRVISNEYITANQGIYPVYSSQTTNNGIFGYRTSMSMKNKDTWEFAHKYCGKVWYVCGMVMLPITVIFMLLVIGKNEDCVGSIGGIICGVQLIPLIGSILPTEIALKKNFDKNGTRR